MTKLSVVDILDPKPSSSDTVFFASFHQFYVESDGFNRLNRKYLKGTKLGVFGSRVSTTESFVIWTNLYTDRRRKLRGIQYNTEIYLLSFWNRFLNVK